jgi:hypothetical protein
VAAAAISAVAFVFRLGRRGHAHPRVATKSGRWCIGAVPAGGLTVGALRALADLALGLRMMVGGAARSRRHRRPGQAGLRSGVSPGLSPADAPQSMCFCRSRRIPIEVHKAARLRGGCSGSWKMVFVSGLVVCYGGGGFGSSVMASLQSAQSSPGFLL